MVRFSRTSFRWCCRQCLLRCERPSFFDDLIRAFFCLCILAICDVLILNCVFVVRWGTVRSNVLLKSIPFLYPMVWCQFIIFTYLICVYDGKRETLLKLVTSEASIDFRVFVRLYLLEWGWSCTLLLWRYLHALHHFVPDQIICLSTADQ